MAGSATEPPLPVGFGVELDAASKELAPGIWFGGSPARVLRLTPGGRAAWARLRTGRVQDPTDGRLARRLTDAGVAHPVPPRETPAADVTVLVPVRDRPAELARCLTALGRAYPVLVVDDGSRDPAPVAAVAQDHGATLLRREQNGGPAAARNTGLAAVRTELVAFVDSDCVPPAGWIDELAGHLADPLLAAVAPRIVPSAAPGARFGWAGRYATSRGALDLGTAPGRVAPGRAISYVPTAALLARRSALLAVARGGYVFDPALRYGEDVDLVWRLDDAGWRVRFEPAVHVAHEEPRRFASLLARRFAYGTSAAPLSRSHPAAIAPLVLHRWPALCVAALLARRPVPAAAFFALGAGATARRLRAADVPSAGTLTATADAVRQTWLGAGRFVTQFAAPVLMAAAALPGRRGRRLAALSLLLGPPLSAWAPRHRAGDPLGAARFALAHVADEIAYGAGVWAGCLTHRTTVPLRPALARPAHRPASLRAVRPEGDHR